MALFLALLPILPAAIAADPVTVTITDTLGPASVTIVPGTPVTWVNQDGDRHRMRSTSGPVDFDTGNLEPGDSYTFTFNSAGVYSYLDDRNDDNPNYFGTIEVTTAGGGGGGGGGEPPPPTGIVVDVVNRLYRPRDITIDAGTTVTWRNIDDRPHTVTARDRSFDSGIFGTGASWERTFNSAGSWEYFCTLHPDMVGTVTVTGGGGEPPPTAPPPTAPPPTEPPPPAPPGDVGIFDNGYAPGSLSVAVGTTVTWSNTGVLPHTVTARSGSFDSGFVMAGETYSRTFDTSGVFEYFCTIHPEMVGTVTVTGGGGEPPPTDPPGGEPVDPIVAGPTDLVVFDNGYDPGEVTVAVGSSLTWVNTGELPHTVTARDGAFDSGFLMSGDAWTTRLDTVGTFEYFCTLHPEMVGIVTVVAGSPPNDGSEPGANATPPERSSSSGSASGGDGGEAAGRSGVVYTVDVIDSDYSPQTATVPAGATVAWVNVGEIPHTVTAGDQSFDSGIMVAGDRFTWTFDEPGTFGYLCTIHPGMVGTVVVAAPVVAGVGGQPSEPPSPSIWVAVIFTAAIAVAAAGLAGGMVSFGRAASEDRRRSTPA